MLAAVVESGAALRALGAIEIESTAYDQCHRRLTAIARGAEVVTQQGNAFDPASWTNLRRTAWDLVITNPPYVRYQRSAEASAGDVAVPSATAVRDGLREVLADLGPDDPVYQEALLRLTDTYSGLADLAVPSWILCASLVKPGGTLAMLVPDTWLSREYAAPLSALLNRFFEIQFVIHDADARWFADASVRTTLFVAQRRDAHQVPRPDLPISGPLHVSVDGRAASASSLVGAAFPNSATPEAAFATAARAWRAAGTGPRREGCRFEPVQQPHGTFPSKAAASITVPPRLHPFVASDGPAMATLDQLGWRVGQGLRTGANAFFYGNSTRTAADQELFEVDQRLGGNAIPVGADLALPVVRGQGDLPPGFALDPGDIPGRVLALHHHVREADRQGRSLDEHRSLALYDLIPPELDAHITTVEQRNLGSAEQPKFVPSLSAVRTNVRPFDPARPDTSPRFWYQLPAFAPRHRPDLCIARVNYRHPRVVLNPDRQVLIDANFSTLWREDATGLDPLAVLALLSSSWAHAAMELVGTVLGGGALKVEAAHLRRLPIPVTVREIEPLLVQTGRMLRDAVDQADTTRAIDDVVASALGLDHQATTALEAVARERLKVRSR